MSCSQRGIGILLGLTLGLLVLTIAPMRDRRIAEAAPILSECDGQLQELVIHYTDLAKQAVLPVYREFLSWLGPEITVYVVCPTRAEFDELLAAAGTTRCRLRPVLVGHAITAWSRDRWLAFTPSAVNGRITIWSPRGEAAEAVWPARAGDERVGTHLAGALNPLVIARRSPLYFDAGDFLADNENVFVVPRVLQHNLQHTVRSREEFTPILAAWCKRRVILLKDSPDHHAGMFMASIGNRRMLVGDPSLGKQLVPLHSERECDPQDIVSSLPDGPDFTPETQCLYDAVASQCAAAGYQVTRMPLVPARDGRTFLTYVNVLLDPQTTRRIVYMPVYRGAESLNTAARQVWENLGYEVRLIDCTTVFRHFGSLHCLVNVLKRSDTRAQRQPSKP